MEFCVACIDSKTQSSSGNGRVGSLLLWLEFGVSITPNKQQPYHTGHEPTTKELTKKDDEKYSTVFSAATDF